MSFPKKIFSFFAVLVLAAAGNACANPGGESVVAGAATFERSTPGTLTVTTASGKTIINYDSFNIAANETVRFNQPGADSAVLNRVVGAEPSAIYGTMSSNGRLFLVNPNGIIFGPGSRVNAPAILASTLDIKNEDFLKGDYKFFESGKGAFIINQGRLAAQPGGYVALLSQAVNNQGVIIADTGTVMLASGEKMTLALDSLSQISVAVDEAVKSEIIGLDGKKITDAISNSGAIQAGGGKVILTARIMNDVFNYAVNNSGLIQAKDLVEHNGVIELLAEGAPVTNSGTALPDDGLARSSLDPLAAIASDKEDYPPSGEPVISGSGFLPGRQITLNIFAPDGAQTVLTAVADAEGRFAMTYAPDSLMEGAYFVIGTDGSRSAVDTFTDKTIKSTSLTVSDITGTYGDTVTLSAVLLEDKKYLKDKTLNFYLDNTPKGSAATDKDGVAALSVDISGVNAGSYLGYIKAEFTGDKNYDASSGTATATINKADLTVTAAGINKVYDGTVTATVTLSDDRVAGDILTAVYTAADFTDRQAGNAKPVSVAGISISGADAANYNLLNATASATADISAGTTPMPVLIGGGTNNQLQPGAGGPLQDHRLGPGYDSQPSFLFYHPLAFIDYSAFNGVILDAGIYDFIDGQLNLKGRPAGFFGITY